jgi:EAL domain-containing protein (putative c-di-GMP-specific phosphodiesterase class I)
MKQPTLPLGVAAMMAVAISIAVGAGVIASGQRLEVAFALAAFLLAGTHLVIFLYRDLYYRRKFVVVGEMHQRSRQLAEQLSALTARVGVLEEGPAEPAAPPKPDTSDLNREFEELRRSIKDLADAYGKASEPSERHREPETPRPEMRREPDLWPSAASETKPAPAEHNLEFFLEPIVSLAEDVTAHYRTSLVLEGGGRRVTFEDLVRQAAANGLRPDLDVHAVSRALAVGNRLTAKRPGMAIFVPIGPETLASPSALAAIEGQIGRAGRAAINLVFEIDHTVLAALGPRGIEGMARLARNGVGMALARAHGMGLDLAALRDLHFRFITFSAAALPTDRHAVPVWAETARLAAEHGFTIGVQGLFYEEQINVATRWALLGSGPVFAPPRRVKGEAIPVNQIRPAA